jgi:hypothetical protein
MSALSAQQITAGYARTAPQSNRCVGTPSYSREPCRSGAATPGALLDLLRKAPGNRLARDVACEIRCCRCDGRPKTPLIAAGSG